MITLMSSTTDVLAELRGSPVAYVTNGGNAGDSLINVGFYEKARELGLDFRVLKRSQYQDVVPSDTVVLGGGGALVPEWPASPRFVINVLPRCSRLIVLPQSVHGVEDVLLRLRPQDTLILRERYSHAYCARLALKCRVMLDHDLAISAPVHRLLHQPTQFKPPTTPANVAREFAVAWHHLRSRRIRTVEAFRLDAEARTNGPRWRRFNDFSSVARFAPGGYEESYYSATRFLQLIDLYDTIYTDRLHVIIGACLLGKKIVAFENSYHKVRGVIEMSLSDYPHLELR